MHHSRQFISAQRSGSSIAALFVVLLILGTPLICVASDTTQELINAVGRLNVQLGTGTTAEGWRKYLQIHRLEVQAAKGEQADLNALAELHQLFCSRPECSQFQPFDDVRIALENQIHCLQKATGHDIQTLLLEADNGFKPISREWMEVHRDLLKHEVDQLQKFQKAQTFSPLRLKAIESMRLGELKRLLDKIEFEQAPEISEGKLNSQLLELRKQLEKVVEKIDAIPVDDENSDSSPEPELPEARSAQRESGAKKDDELKLLRSEEAALKDKIQSITKKRNDVRKGDEPRKKKRAENLKTLYEIEDQFSRLQIDMGDPYTYSTHFALEKFTRIYRYGTDDNLQEDYLKNLQELRTVLQRLDDPVDRRGAALVGNKLEWLEYTKQAPFLVAAIRARHSYPNIYMHISGDLLNRLGSRPVNESREICEEVKGKPLKGHASTSGVVSFELVDDPDQIHISVRSLANIQSQTQLDQDPILVQLQSRGQAEARRSLVANLGGLYTDDPYAAANMDTQLCGTDSGWKLVDKIVAKKFAEGKANTDATAASRIRREILEKFRVETDKVIAQAQVAFGKVRNAGLEYFGLMPVLYIHSANNRINLIGKRVNRWNFAAPNFPDQSSVANDLEIRLHDSLPSNYIEPFFRGKTFSNEELANELKRILQSDQNPLAPNGKPGDDKKKKEQDKPFTITFSEIRPVQFVFDDNRLAIIVSATKFTQEDKKINAGLTITLRFKFIQENGQLLLVRDGETDLAYIEGQEKDAGIVAFRSILNSKLNPEGEEQAEMKIALPANLLPLDKVPALKDKPIARELHLNQFRIERGWLYLGWKHVPGSNPGVAFGPQELPAISTQVTAQFSDSYYTPPVVVQNVGDSR